MQLTGIHHLTAVSADAPGNVAFYKGVLGMRLVKKTVNQDDVSAYHLFYADGLASPGTRPHLLRLAGAARAARHACDRAHRAARRRAGDARLVGEAPRRCRHPQWRARRARRPPGVLDFEDPEGQRLALVDDGGAGEAHPWDGKPGARRSIRSAASARSR